MTTTVKVAVYIDRGEAIRAGRNKWDWQSTELDLEALGPCLREALSRCPEKDGAVQITHSEIRPGSRAANPWLDSHELRDSFELEREGMPYLVEATPVTALQMLEHLASLPSRLRAQGAGLRASAEAEAANRGAQALSQAAGYLADLDRWLSTAPDQLVVEHEEDGFHSSRFQRVEGPTVPKLATIHDLQIAYDLKEAQRLIDGERPRVGSERPGADRSEFDFFAPRQTHTFPEHLAVAQNALVDGLRTRAEAVDLQRRATAAVAQERFRGWQNTLHKQAEEERRAAAAVALRAKEARKDAANNKALREWAITYDQPKLLELLDAGAPAAQITSALRSILLEPFARFKSFKKITKQDLVMGNPNHKDMAFGLDAMFEEVADEFTDPNHQATARAIVLASFEANIPAEFEYRLHRGRLARRDETIGIPLEARSLLFTARFGDLKISRAFAIGILAPAQA